MWAASKTKEKMSLIRALLVERITSDPEAIRAGFGESDVRSMSDPQLLASPEATIVTIAQRVYELSATRRLDEASCIGIVNNERRFAGYADHPPSNLVDFIVWRVKMEHKTAALHRRHVLHCAFAGEDLARRQCGRIPQDEDAFFYGQLRAVSYEMREVSAVVGDYYDGLISEDEFHDKLGQATRAMMERREAASLLSRGAKLSGRLG